MEKLELYKTSELSFKETKNIGGGVLIGVCICLFALGMAVGIGIGVSQKRR